VSQIFVRGAGLAEIFVLVNEGALMPNPFGVPERTTAAAFPRYSSGAVLADSASLQWPGLFVRRSRFPRAVDRFLVPATPEPLMSCVLAGSAEFQERDLGGVWVPRQVRRGDIFVTGSKTPYELRWRSPFGSGNGRDPHPSWRGPVSRSV